MINGGSFSSGLKNTMQLKFDTDTKNLLPIMSFTYKYPSLRQKLEKILNLRSLDIDYIKENNIKLAKLNQITYIIIFNKLEKILADNIKDKNSNIDKIIAKTKKEILANEDKTNIAKFIDFVQNLPEDINLNNLEEILKEHKIDAMTSNLTFNTLSNLQVFENQKKVATFQAKDSNDNKISYSINGDDKDFFEIDKFSGKLSFKNPPNYEVKTSYNISISASNGFMVITKPIIINIKNVYEYSENINNTYEIISDINNNGHKLRDISNLSVAISTNLVLQDVIKSVGEGSSQEALYKKYFADTTTNILQKAQQDLYFRNIIADEFFKTTLKYPSKKVEIEKIFKKYLGEYKKYDNKSINKKMISASVLTFGNLLAHLEKNTDENLENEILSLFVKYLGNLSPESLEGNIEAKYYRNLAVSGLVKIVLKNADKIDKYQEIFQKHLGVISPEELKADKIAMYYRNKSLSLMIEYIARRYDQTNFENIKTKILDKYFQKASFFKNQPAFNDKESISGKIESFQSTITAIARRPDINTTMINTFKEYLGSITPELIGKSKNTIELRNKFIGKLLENSAREPQIIPALQDLTDKYLGVNEDYKNNEYYKNSISSKILAFKTLLKALSRQPELNATLEGIFIRYLGDISQELKNQD